MKIEQTLKLSSIISESMQKNKVFGLAMSLISHGTVTLTETYGITNSITQEAVQLNTKFEAASLTKPLFAYLVLLLRDQGQIDLDVPVAEYLPEYEISLDPRYKLITPRIVLCHSSGFENWSKKPVSISFDPGSQFQYSGEAFVYLQKAVERVTGKDLEQLLIENIFKPLQMNNSAMVRTESVNKQLSNTYDKEGKMEQKRVLTEDSGTTEPNAAYSLYTTIEDYTQFLLNLMDQKIIPLHQSSFNDMIHAHNTISKELFWGLGWGIYQKESMLLWHWGDNGGFKAFVCLDLETKSGALICTNSFNGLPVCFDIASCVTGVDFTPIREFIARKH
jgi:CubicO group peptidase (beta-lactamase class C family)